jgi:hypothetical protein
MSLNISDIGLPQPTLEFYTECDAETLKLSLIYGHKHILRQHQQDTDALDNDKFQSIKSNHNKEIEQLKTQNSVITNDFTLLKIKYEQLFFNTEREVNSLVKMKTEWADERDNTNKIILTDYKEKISKHQLYESTLKEIIDTLEKEVQQKIIEKTGSKTKGNLGESEIKQLIESHGYIVTKPGMKAGDLWVYHKKEHIAVLEIKNWKCNTSKLGRHRDGELGSEMVKFYRDIDEQLNTMKTTTDIPWAFFSLACEIPEETTLSTEHNNVKCFYHSQPSEQDIIQFITFCKHINTIIIQNKNKNRNTDFMQCKIQELYKIITDFTAKRYNFASIEKMLCDAVKTAENNMDIFYKDQKKYNDKYTKIDKRMCRIMKNIDEIHPSDIDLLNDFDTERHTLEERADHIKQLRLLALQQQSQIRTLENTNLDDSAAKNELTKIRKMVLTDFYEQVSPTTDQSF